MTVREAPKPVEAPKNEGRQEPVKAEAVRKSDRLLAALERDQFSDAASAAESVASGPEADRVLQAVTASLSGERDPRRRNSLRAVEKKLRYGDPDMQLVTDGAGIHTALTLRNPANTRSTPSRIRETNRPVYIEDGLSLANLDPGAPLLRGIDEEWRADNISVAEVFNRNAAVFVPDQLVVNPNASNLHSTRRTRDVSTPSSGSRSAAPDCRASDPPDQCLVFLVMRRRN